MIWLLLGGLKDKEELKGYQVVHFQPFDPVHKRTEATVKTNDGKTFKVTKGAPQVILELSANTEQVKPTVQKAITEFAARGFRSLGVAQTDEDRPMAVSGCIPPIRPSKRRRKVNHRDGASDGRDG